MRIYDPRLGKFLSVDPIAKRFPELSTYQFAGNSPIANVDLDGEEPKKVNEKVQETWYGKVKTNTIDFLGAAYMTTVNVFGALSEIPGQMHSNKMTPQQEANRFPLTYGQNFATLALGAVEGPIIAIAKVANYPTDAKAWGELTATTLLYKGVFKEGALADEFGVRPGVLKDANFAQVGINKAEVFSPKGQEIYSKVAGTSIRTVGDLVTALKDGKVLPSQLPVDYVTINNTKVILNTRTATTLTRAGIPQSEWYGVDKTGMQVPGMSGVKYDDLAKKQTEKSGLPPTGTSTPPK
jgi:hypothetical protein